MYDPHDPKYTLAHRANNALHNPNLVGNKDFDNEPHLNSLVDR